MGRIAYENEDYYHTIRWMSEALEQAELEGDQSGVEIVTILDYLSFSTAKVCLNWQKFFQCNF